MNAIEIKQISKKYEQFHLNDISFSLPAGSIMGLIGENGAGKSTIINCIIGMIPTDSGVIRILDKENRERTIEDREDLGIVFDISDFYDNYTMKQVESILKDVYKRWDSTTFAHYIDTFALPKEINQRL